MKSLHIHVVFLTISCQNHKKMWSCTGLIVMYRTEQELYRHFLLYFSSLSPISTDFLQKLSFQFFSSTKQAY